MKPGFWLRLVVSLMLLCALLMYVDWRKTLQEMALMSPVPVLLAFIISPVNILVSSLKWQGLLLAKSMRIGLPRLVRCYWVSEFFANFLPTTFGGDAIRLVMMRSVKRSAVVAASIFIERITGLIVLLMWSGFALGMRPGYFDFGWMYGFLWLFITATGIGMAAMWAFGDAVISFLKNHTAGPAGLLMNALRKLVGMAEIISSFRSQGGRIMLALILSAIFYGVFFLGNCLVVYSINSEISVREIFMVAPIVPLVSILPISVNGFGISEGVFVVLFTQIGLSPSEALAAAVVRRAIRVMVSTAGGFIWLRARSVEDSADRVHT